MAFEHMSEGFRARAKEVRALLLGPEAAFVLVASPESESVKQAQGFLTRLESSRVRVAGIVANRVRVWPGGGPAPAFEAADPAPLARALADERAARAAIDAATRYAALVRRDALALDGLREHAERRGGFFRVVPEQRGDVHDLSGLRQVAAALAQASESETVEQEDAMAASGRSSAQRRGGRGTGR
jgi:anion-transporting  ArsA/GET3 family ATPase